MQLPQFPSCLLVLIFATACGPSVLFNPAKVEQELIKNAKADVPYVKQFHVMFPKAPVYVYSDSLKAGTTRAQIEEIVFDRYLLTLTIHFEVNRKLEVTSYAEPLITLVEITKVTGDSNGPISSDCGINYKISPDQWRKVVGSDGQFSATGLDLKTNEPVAGIEELRRYLHRMPIQ